MFLAQHLLTSSNISLNAANLSLRHRSCRVLALSKDIMAFMKTRRLKLILAENIGWPTSTLKSRRNFRKCCPSKPLAYEIPKKERTSSLVTSLRYVHLSLRRTSSGSCSINAIIFLLVLFKTVVIISSVKEFAYMSIDSFLLHTLFCGLRHRGIILAALHLPLETVETVHFYGVLSILVYKHSLGIGGSNAS